MFGLAPADLIVIALYFAVMIGIGFWSSRRIKNQEDYFLAGRRFGKLVQTFAAFGQATSADNAVGVTTTTFNNGIAGIWSSLLYLFATPALLAGHALAASHAGYDPGRLLQGTLREHSHGRGLLPDRFHRNDGLYRPGFQCHDQDHRGHHAQGCGHLQYPGTDRLSKGLSSRMSWPKRPRVSRPRS